MEIQNGRVQNGVTNVISVKRLLRPISKSLFLIVVLSFSTGPLILKLIQLSISDLFAFIIGFLWLLGDILSCIALVTTLYDVILIGKRDDAYQLVVRGKCVPLSDLISTLFIFLYFFDFIIVCFGYVKVRFNLGDGYPDLLESYRYGVFNLQIFVSILYVTRPWAWGQFDLRNIMTNMKRFYLLLFEMAESISVYLKGSRADDYETTNDDGLLQQRGSPSSQTRKSAKISKTSRPLQSRKSVKKSKISLSSRSRKSVRIGKITRSLQSKKSVKRSKIYRSSQSQRSVERARASVSRRAKHTTTVVVKHVCNE